MARFKRKRERASFDVAKEFPELGRRLACEKAMAPPGFDQPASAHYQWISETARVLADTYFSSGGTDSPAGAEERELSTKKAFALATQVEIYLPEVYRQIEHVGSGLGFGGPHNNHAAAVAEWRMIQHAARAKPAADSVGIPAIAAPGNGQIRFPLLLWGGLMFASLVAITICALRWGSGENAWQRIKDAAWYFSVAALLCVVGLAIHGGPSARLLLRRCKSQD